MARNSIILNGKSSDTITGLIIQELPPISKPLMRSQVEEIDGRDGDIITKLGFSAYDKEISVGLYGNFDINEIIAYFNSEGTVTFSNEPDKFYYYQILEQIDFERLVRFRTATINFHVQPFKYSTTEEAETIEAGTVSGEGNNLVLENTSDNPFSKLTPKGDAYQQTYSGKNLWSLLPSYTNDTSGARWVLSDTAVSFPAGTYTFSSSVSTVSSANKVNFKYANNTDNIIIISDGTATVTFTEEVKKAAIYLSGEATISNIQLEAGSTATTYEPYVGGVPSPNPNYPQDIQVVTGEQTVKVMGKNLLDISQAGWGYINANGVPTATSNPSNWLSDFIKVEPNKTYTLSITNAATGDTNIALQAAYYDNNQGLISREASASGRTRSFTTPNDCGWIRVWAAKSPEWTAETKVSYKPQLELGSTATAYEPYQGQSYEVNLGKNLFNYSDSDWGWINTSGQVVANYQNKLSDYIKVSGGSAYTVSLSSNDTTNISFAFFNSSKTLLSRDTSSANLKSRSVTAPDGAFYMRFWIYKSPNWTDETAAAANIQCEAGSVATTYSAYFTPIELAKIGNYEDYPWKDGDTWKVHKETGKVVFGGTEAWVITTNNNAFYVTKSDAITINQDATSPILSDNYTANTYRALYNATADYGISYHPTSARIIIRNKDITTAADFKTWLSTHNTTVYYALATPTDTAITDETLISQLEALNAAHAYKGRTHIISTAGSDANLPHIIEAKVLGSSDTTITNAGNFISKPKFTIYGSGNIGLYINGIQILQIALGDEQYITIDAAQMEAYKDTLDNLKNRLVTGDYTNLALNPGENQISFSGSVEKYIVENYSRWL